MNTLCLLAEVPVCAFRPYASREYQDTYPVPTPSAVYGMLLSLVGVPRSGMLLHRGVEMALAVECKPEQSKVFRKLRRGKDLENRRPDYQDLLIDLRLWVWVRRGEDRNSPSLPERVKDALDRPEAIDTRSGGLSLGESSYLVDSITYREDPPSELFFLCPMDDGFYSLPVWVDHKNASNTRLCRFALCEPQPVDEGLKRAWFKIGAPCIQDTPSSPPDPFNPGVHP